MHLPRPTGTPFDPVSVEQLPDVISQLTYFQWNYKDVYVPPHLLHGLLTESNAMERQNAVWEYASIGKSASIVVELYRELRCWFDSVCHSSCTGIRSSAWFSCSLPPCPLILPLPLLSRCLPLLCIRTTTADTEYPHCTAIQFWSVLCV